MSTLPIPSVESQQHSQQLSNLVQQEIQRNGGWLSFAAFMHLALYTPTLGYYSGGLQKFGDSKLGGGDFVTAPEISPLFAQSLAEQAVQVLSATHGDILELGAGTGQLAADLLLALASRSQLPQHYYILEVSGHLRAKQQETLKAKLPAALFDKLVWLNDLPTGFTGLMLGNEVLDALPVHLIVKKADFLYERGVVADDGFQWQEKPLQDAGVLKYVDTNAWPDDYFSEVCPAVIALVSRLAASLNQGALLLLDYGFPAQEYYHPQRNQGTLMCHYQHHAHADPLRYIGLQDITAHVNFTAVAEAGVANGLDLYGYINQAQFLMNCGLLDLLKQTSPDNSAAYIPMAAAAQKLLSPSEMGELFKVIMFTKGLRDDIVLLGFSNGDKSHTL